MAQLRPWAERWSPLGLGTLLAGLLLWVRYPPGADLPQYELQIASLLAMGDPVRFPNSVYAVSWGGPNQLFFTLAWGLGSLVGADLATRLLWAAIAGGLVAAVGMAASGLGKSPWVAWVASALVFGMPFHVGLVSNLLGILGFLVVLPALDRLGRAPSTGRSLVATAGVVLATLAHTSVVAMVTVVVIVYGLAHWRDWRGHVRRGLPALVAGLIALSQMRIWDENATPEFLRFSDAQHPRLQRLVNIPELLLGVEDQSTAWLFLVSWMAAAGFLLWPSPQGRRWRDPLFATGVLLTALFFILPYGYRGSGLVYLRFLFPGIVVMLLALTPEHLRRGPGQLAALLAIPVATVMALLPVLFELHRGFMDLEPLITLVEPGNSVLGLNFRESGALPGRLLHAPAHVVAHRGGRCSSFAQLPQYPVRFRPGTSWAVAHMRLSTPQDLVPEVDLQRFRYVLVDLPSPEALPLVTLALGDSVSLRGTSGEWALFESSLPTIPLDAPEAPLPPVHGTTLGERIQRVSRGLPAL